MKKIFDYTEDGIEIDFSEAMKDGKEKKSYGAPDLSKHYFKTKEEAMKDGKKMGLAGVHSHKDKDGKVVYMAGKDHASFMKKHKEGSKESDAAMNPKQKAALDKNKDGKISKEDFEMLRKSKSMDKKQYDKIDKKELKKDSKKEKVEHEKDAIKDDKSKIKKLEKGAPSEKKSVEKKDIKKDIKFDKESKKKMEAGHHGDMKKEKIKKSYAQILTDIAAQKYRDGV